MELFFDVETSGFINKKLSASDPKQAWCMQLAFILSDQDRIFTEFSSLITSEGRTCNPHAQKVHGISTAECNRGGISEDNLLNIIIHGFFTADILVAHNYSFDIEMIDQFIRRSNTKWAGLKQIPFFCTMKETTALCKLPQPKYPGKFKWPKLEELYKFLFDEKLVGTHDALADVRATRRCYYKLKDIGFMGT
jgi:DNA polymerase III epsilon subunit-like protein